MPDPVTAARYRARDGTEHQVLVERSAAGRWRVLDAVDDDAIVVDTLTGLDDRLDQAVALARDYAAEQQAHHDDAWRRRQARARLAPPSRASRAWS
jgi:hypothetical protein